MSYEKAMKHTRNVRKCRKQANNYMGFDTGSGHWPSIRSTEFGEAYVSVREWFRDRHLWDKEQAQHTRECIREQIAVLRKYKPKKVIEYTIENCPRCRNEFKKGFFTVCGGCLTDMDRASKGMAPVHFDVKAHALIKSPGQIAYENDLVDTPTYDDGENRRQWHQLDDITKWSWERNPTPRQTTEVQ